MSRATTIINGPKSRARAQGWVAKAPNGTVVELREDTRSPEQNKKMWALLTECGAQLKLRGRRYDKDRWKAIMLHAWGQEVEFLPTLDDDYTFFPWGRQTSKLSKQEMAEFIEFIIAEGTKRGVVFQDDPVPT